MRHNSTIDKPKYASVSRALLRDPPFSGPDAITTRALNTLLYVSNCGAKVIRANWDKKGKDHWSQPGRLVSFTLNVNRFCHPKLWNIRSPTRLRKHLDRLMEPVGPWPAPVREYKFSESKRFVSITLDASWVHVPPPFDLVDLPLPMGKRSVCRAYLATFIKDDKPKEQAKAKPQPRPEPVKKPGSFF